MKTLQKFGAFSALYMAAAYLIGMAIFLAVLDYPSITDPTQKVTLLVEKQMIILFDQPVNVRVLWRIFDRTGACAA